MKILIFGRNGQVARTLVEEARDVHEATALGRDTTDLMIPGAAADAIGASRPDVVVNAAAYTAVDNAESEPESAARLNAQAPAEMATASAAIGAPFVHLSTDYVFGGEASRAYAEEDPVGPLNVYGATKRDGERAVIAGNAAAVIIRTSWVFSEFGNNFVTTMLRLAGERDQLSIVSDQIGGPTAARDIARAVLVIAGKKHRGAPGAGIYHFQGAPAVSWADFARKIFEIAQKNVAVTDIPTSEYKTPASRPLQTILDCSRIERDFGVGQPDWRGSLRQVMGALSDKETSQ